MQFVALRQAFNGPDLLAIRLHRKHQAGTHRVAVHDHRAGAADTVLAADVSAGLAAVLADRISECAPRLDFDRIAAAVDIERDRGFPAHAVFSALRVAARIRWGAAGISSVSNPDGERAEV